MRYANSEYNLWNVLIEQNAADLSKLYDGTPAFCFTVTFSVLPPAAYFLYTHRAQELQLAIFFRRT